MPGRGGPGRGGPGRGGPGRGGPGRGGPGRGGPGRGGPGRGGPGRGGLSNAQPIQFSSSEMLKMYSMYQPLGASANLGPREIQEYYKKLGKTVSDSDACLMVDLFLYGPDPKTGLPNVPEKAKGKDGSDAEDLPSIDFSTFCRHLAQRAGSCVSQAIHESEELMRTLSPDGVGQVLVAAGVEQGSKDMTMMKQIIRDPRTKSYAEAGLAERIAEALKKRKVAKDKKGKIGGALQMNFRSGGSPLRAASGPGNTVRF